MKVNLAEILDAIEQTDTDSQYYLDKETGKIEWINNMIMDANEVEEISDRLDEHGCYCLPSVRDIDEYSIMADFADTFSGDILVKLSSALDGRGAFRRFKDTLYRLGIEKAWYSFRDNAYKDIAIRWCEDNNIEYEE